ncbi:MAG: SagB/ThcOx family dehydrogenase [candidate division Zixibacteria bacterium]
MKNQRRISRPLEWVLENRMTVREITGGQIPSEYLDKLVWAAYGNTHNDGRTKMRTAPSAGATYPVELYIVVERIVGLDNGIYRYSSKAEKPVLMRKGIFLSPIRKVSLDQDFISLSNIAFIMVYNPQRIIDRYGRDSRKYAILESGHIAQNILLMATAFDLGGVPVGAFYQKRLGSILEIDENREVLYMICVGTID